MAKHGKKKIIFHFGDLEFATFFMDFIRKKKFYARVSGNMNYKGKLEFTLVGSPEYIKMGIIKIKNLYHKAYDNYLLDKSYIERGFNAINKELEDNGKIDDKDDDKFVMSLNKKKLKFDVR